MTFEPVQRATLVLRGALHWNLGRNLCAVLAVLAAVGLSPANAADDSLRSTPELRERAISAMRQVLNQEQGFVKVHAAECLLSLGYDEGVEDAFASELQSHSADPKYRIGIWRILASTAKDDCQQAKWMDKVRDVLFDPAAPDRACAAETLVKRRHRLRDDEVKQVKEFAETAEDSIIAYAVCILVNAGQTNAEARLAKLLQSANTEVRLTAAYSMRYLPSISISTKEKLQSAAQREPRDSPARIYLIQALAMHSLPHVDPAVKAELGEFVVRGRSNDRVDACLVLSQVADRSDLPLLSRLLDDPSPDLRSTAGYAILRVGRRVPNSLAIWDWAVIVGYVLGMLSVGWYYSLRTKTQEQYLLGDRQMRPLMVGVSLFASLFSCISYLAMPGEIIKYGPMILGGILAYPFAGLIIGWFIIPFIMKLKVTSAYEILELRFGPVVRTLGSLLFLSLRLMWMSVIVYAMTTKVLVPLSGLPPWTTPIVCTLLALVTIVYTAMGGLRAVVITDVIQAVILFGAAIVTIVTISVNLGGVHAWWPTHWPAHWPEPQFGYDPSSRVPLFVIIVSTLAWYVCTSASDQIAIQRYLSTKDAKAARSVLFISLAADVCVSIILAMVGLAILAYFRTYPHLLPDNQTVLSDSDKLFPQFILIGLPIGLSGLVVAGLLACAMSALSAGINSTCSVLTVDILDRIRGKTRSAKSGLERVGELKHVSFLIGLIVVGLSLFVSMVEGNLLEICYKVVNLLTAPLAGLFLLAMFVPWARTFGVLVGAACGLAVVIAISYWREITGTQGISFLWAMPLSLVAEVGVGAVVSLLPFGRKPLPIE